MMFIPDFYFKSICDITPELLKEHGISFLLLDIDNTLTFDFDPELPLNVEIWLNTIKQNNITCAIVSNNGPERGKPIAEKCDLPLISSAHKPSTASFEQVKKMLGCTSENTAMIGDQLFTDIWYGNRLGMLTIFVEPMGGEKLLGVKIKRVLEKPFMRAVRRRSIK